MMWQAMYERAIAVSDRWKRLYRERSRCYDLQTHELERLKGVVKRLQEVAEKQQRDINQLEFSKEYFENETKRLRTEVIKSEIPYPKTASEVYAAQNELELLRNIRHSQGEGIARLRQQLTEACAERDAASIRANDWRGKYNRVLSERDSARTAFNKACDRIQELIKERDEMYREMDGLRKDLKVSEAVNHIISRREQHNPRLEIILEESYRNEFKRNIDNQKATDGVSPNCPSS